MQLRLSFMSLIVSSTSLQCIHLYQCTSIWAQKLIQRWKSDCWACCGSLRYVVNFYGKHAGLTCMRRLRESWYAALDNAQAHFRQLLTSHSSSEWKRIPTSNDVGSPVSKGKARASTIPELSDVILHRRASKSGENIYRAVLEVPIGDEPVSLGAWKSVLVTPELRKEWDPAVESAQLLEMFDQATRISKVNFTLGWPAK